MVFKPGESGYPQGKWRPGQSGNPLGRGAGKRFQESMNRLREKLAKTGEDADDEVALGLYNRAKNGDTAAIQQWADRTDGKVPTPIGGTDELPAIKGFAWLDPTKTASSE